MTKTLMLQLPDELERRLTVKAELLNLSVEDLALSSLSESVGSTTLQEVLHQANRLVVVEIFNRLRTAKQQGQERVDVPATDLSRKLVEMMKPAKSGGVEAVKQLLDYVFKNPVAAVVAESVKAFVETEASL